MDCWHVGSLKGSFNRQKNLLKLVDSGHMQLVVGCPNGKICVSMYTDIMRSADKIVCIDNSVGSSV